jgi:hypothetical protein
MGVALKTFEREGYSSELVWEHLVNAAEIWNKYSHNLYKIVLYQDWKKYSRKVAKKDVVYWSDFKEDKVNTIALVERGDVPKGSAAQVESYPRETPKFKFCQEVDMFFFSDTKYRFGYDTCVAGFSNVPFFATAVHEFGHVLGLSDPEYIGRTEENFKKMGIMWQFNFLRIKTKEMDVEQWIYKTPFHPTSYLIKKLMEINGGGGYVDYDYDRIFLHSVSSSLWSPRNYYFARWRSVLVFTPSSSRWDLNSVESITRVAIAHRRRDLSLDIKSMDSMGGILDVGKPSSSPSLALSLEEIKKEYGLALAWIDPDFRLEVGFSEDLPSLTAGLRLDRVEVNRFYAWGHRSGFNYHSWRFLTCLYERLLGGY